MTASNSNNGDNTPDTGAYLPTPEEIAERAREVREVGFFGRAQSTYVPRWYPPWSDVERLRRLV